MIIYILIYLIFSTLGLFLLKASLISVKFNSIVNLIELVKNVEFVVGFFLYGLSFIVWLFLLSKKDLSYIYPIVIGLSYLFVILTSVLFLNEGFTVAKLIGVILVGLGVVVIIIQN